MLSQPTACDAESGEHEGDGFMEFLGRRANIRLDVGALVGDLADVARVADQQGAVMDKDEDAGFAGKAGEVGDVDGTGDQQGVEPFLDEDTVQVLAPTGVVVHATISTWAAFVGAGQRSAV